MQRSLGLKCLDEEFEWGEVGISEIGVSEFGVFEEMAALGWGVDSESEAELNVVFEFAMDAEPDSESEAVWEMIGGSG